MAELAKVVDENRAISDRSSEKTFWSNFGPMCRPQLLGAQANARRFFF